jgi:aminomethyltransferase
MGQVILSGARIAADLERLVPADIAGLGDGRVRYTVFTNEAGGILDDLMVGKSGDALRLVVNAACKAADLDHLRRHLGASAIRYLDDHSLLALQGPEAANVLARLAPETTALGFMRLAAVTIAGTSCHVTRSGYTGEDGFEISVPASGAEALAHRLLAEPEVAPAGLGARDTLRLEAGLCLYGNDIDETTSVIEADLGWTIQPRRRQEGGFPGAALILRQLAEGVSRRRIGIKPEGRQIARAATPIVNATGMTIGTVTSGGFGPSVDGAIAMGYVETAYAAPGTGIGLVVRGVTRPARVANLPFVPHRYHQSPARKPA